MAITARYPGRCQGCPDPIMPGDVVEKTRHGWAHQACAPARTRIDLSRREPTAAGYQALCSTCGAEPGGSCTTRSGMGRPMHSVRRSPPSLP